MIDSGKAQPTVGDATSGRAGPTLLGDVSAQCSESGDACPVAVGFFFFFLFLYELSFFPTAGVPSGSKVSKHGADPIKLHSCIFNGFPIETRSLLNNRSSSEKEVGAGQKGI